MVRSKRSVEDQVKQILADELCLDEDEVIPEAKIIDDLGADSLDQVELVMALEDAFDIEIPDEDVEVGQEKTVQDVIDYIARKTGALAK